MSRLIKRHLPALSMLVASALALPGYAGESNPSVPKKEASLRIVTMVNASERPQLFATFQRLNDEMCRRMQHRCSLEYFPPARAAAMVESGEADGENYRVLDFIKDGKQPHHLRVNAALYTTSFVALGKPTSPTLQSWMDLMLIDKEIIYLFGSKLVPDRMAAIASGRLMATHSVESGVRMLTYERAAYFITADSNSVCNTIDRLNLSAAIVQRGVIEKVDTFMYLNDKHAAIAPRMRAAIQSMHKDGTHAALLRESTPLLSGCGRADL